MADTFAACLDDAASRWQGREALVIGDQHVTFAGLAQRSRALAGGWLALGVARGDRVGLLLENSVAWADAFWSLARIGAVVVPLNTRWTKDELRFVLAQAELRAVLVGDRFRGLDFSQMLSAALEGVPGKRPIVVQTGGVAEGAVSLAALAGLGEVRGVEAAQAAVRGEDVAVIQFTSGSTAFPKGAMLRQAAMIEYVRDYGTALGVVPEDRVLCPMPFFHIAGLNHVLLVPAVQGATIVAAERFDPDTALRDLLTERCTVFGGVSTMYLRMADRATDPVAAFRGIEKSWFQGSSRLAHMVYDRIGVRGMTTHYGVSEMSGATTFGDVRDPLETRLGNAGRVMPGVETRIVDPATGADAAPGAIGEIWHRGRRLMAGYFGLERSAWNIDEQGWFHTGDLGAIDAEGYLTFHGRLKDMLKVGGENVACAEVEEALLSHPAVRLAALIGVPDDQLEEVPIAFVELRDGAAAAAAALIEHCARSLARFKVPRRIIVLDALPMTGSDKIHKPGLRALAMDRLGFGAQALHEKTSQ
jgi:acyl-CoA synthetase (AMP-forming)/AMP-acid ligase II